QLFDSRDVGLRPAALRLSRGEKERGPLPVHRAGLAVHPAETESLLDRRVVVDPRPAGGLLPRDEPDAGRALVVGLRPIAPLRAILELDGAVLVHSLGDRVTAAVSAEAAPA